MELLDTVLKIKCWRTLAFRLSVGYLFLERRMAFGRLTAFPEINFNPNNHMKKLFLTLTLVAAASLAATNLVAADAKDYQVTGAVLEVNPTFITVIKGEEKFQIATDAATKGAKPKVGDKVTVHYSMTASSIEVKADKSEKKTDQPAKK